MQDGQRADPEGAQDAGKSSAFRTIFSQRWFTDANIIIGDKDSYAVMAGKWVIELAELDALSKSESSNSKRFRRPSTRIGRRMRSERSTYHVKACSPARSTSTRT